MNWMDNAKDQAMTTEPTKAQIEAEAQALRIVSGFKVTIKQARDRVCDSLGWVNWAHMLRCKEKRNQP